MQTPTKSEGAEGKEKTGKNMDMLNLTRNSRLCSHKFSQEQINTDCEMSGDPLFVYWNNCEETIVEKVACLQKPRMIASSAHLHAMVCGSWVAPI